MNKKVETEMKELALFVPIVAKVHGAHHPEFYQVRENFHQLETSLETNDTKQIPIIFENIRQITDNYTVPDDVCESYARVYELLEQLDKELN